MKKIYQVNEKHFFVSNGIEYLSAVSPFTKGLAYKDKETAIMVANGLINGYKEEPDTIEVSNLTETSIGLIGEVKTKHFMGYRIVITIEEIEIK